MAIDQSAIALPTLEFAAEHYLLATGSLATEPLAKGPDLAHSRNMVAYCLSDATSGEPFGGGDSSTESLLDSGPALIWTSDSSHSRDFVNQRWLDFRGRTLAEELGNGWTDGLHPTDRPRVITTLREGFETRRLFQFEYRLRRHDDQYRWLLATCSPRFTPDGSFAGYVGHGIDITERKQIELELEAQLAASDRARAALVEQTQHLFLLAESDPLTGVLNRRSFRDQFSREWNRSVRYERDMACILLDLDFFKNINDTHGHAAGDAVLKRVADLLIAQCRPSDRVCRYGGEEFCILPPETSESGAAILAERLRTTMAALPMQVGNISIWISGSFGVAERTPEMNEVDDLIGRADLALNNAKRAGRNAVVRYSRDLGREAFELSSPSQILAQYTARDLAAPSTSIGEQETIQAAIELLLCRQLTSVPVVDAAGKLAGIVSDRDLLLVDTSRDNGPRYVHDVMKSNVVFYDEDSPGDQIYQFLCRVSIPQVVVVANGRPTGVINPGTLLEVLRRRESS